MKQPPKKPPEFSPTRRLQDEYARGVRRIVGRVLSPKAPEETLEQWTARLAARSQEQDIQTASEFLARQMYKWASVKNARTWREAARRSQRPEMLHRLLQEELRGATGSAFTRLVRENAALISSLPVRAATMVTDEVAKAQQAGARPATTAKMLRARFPQLLRSRVHLIARTETAKASTALTQARCEELDLRWYEWLTSDDARVRDSHRKMNGVLVPWDHAPDPEALVGEKSYGHYHAGQTFNCRCGQAPLLAFEDVAWPHPVYWSGKIRSMTLVDFKKIAGGGVEHRAAA